MYGRGESVEAVEAAVETVRRHWPFFHVILPAQVDDMVDYLIENYKYDEYNYQKLKAKHTAIEKIKRILRTLNFRSRKTFEIFLEALKYAGQGSLAEIMKEDYNKAIKFRRPTAGLQVTQKHIPWETFDQENTEVKVPASRPQGWHTFDTDVTEVKGAVGGLPQDPWQASEKASEPPKYLDEVKSPGIFVLNVNAMFGVSQRSKRRIVLTESIKLFCDCGIVLEDGRVAPRWEGDEQVYIKEISAGSAASRAEEFGSMQKGFTIYKINGKRVTTMDHLDSLMESARQIHSFTVLPCDRLANIP